MTQKYLLWLHRKRLLMEKRIRFLGKDNHITEIKIQYPIKLGLIDIINLWRTRL